MEYSFLEYSFVAYGSVPPINQRLMEPHCIWFCVGSRKGLRNLNFKAILHFRMNNSYLNILLIYAPLRYGSEFSLWQILNRKIFFSTLLLQTCYLLLTSRLKMGRATLKPVQIDTSLYSRKSPKLTHSSEIEKVEISRFVELRKFRGRNGLHVVGKVSWKNQEIGKF